MSQDDRFSNKALVAIGLTGALSLYAFYRLSGRSAKTVKGGSIRPIAKRQAIDSATVLKAIGSNQTRTLTLNSGFSIPLIGLGTWKATAEGEVYRSVKAAIENGYRHIDCAAIYGNEKEVGRALHEVLKVDKIVKREELFVTSKLWNTNHEPSVVSKALRQTLDDLQLDYLDLYLIHWPLALEHTGIPVPADGGAPKDPQGYPKLANVSLETTWRAMEDLYFSGLTKSIGVSNYRVTEILDVVSYARVLPAMNQIEYHPHLVRDGLVQACHHYGIQVTAYSPFGSSDAGPAGPLNEPLIKKLAQKYERSCGQIILRWVVQKGICVIPKSVKVDRIRSNGNVFDFTLSEDDVRALDGLHKGHVYVDPAGFFGVKFLE